MSSPFHFQILINLKSMDIINIRQANFYQLRLTVYQTDDKRTNIFAMPFLILKAEAQLNQKLQRSTTDISNTPQIDCDNNTFLSRKFVIRNIDDRLELNQMCIFKGVFLANKDETINNRIKIYAQLLNYQQNEIEVIAEWEGHTLISHGQSYCPMYFNSYKFTCNINTSVHLIVSSIGLENLIDKDKEELAKLGNSCFYKKYSQYLEESIQMLKEEIAGTETQQKGQINQMFWLGPDKYRYCEFKAAAIAKTQTEQQIEAFIDKLEVSKYVQLFKQSIYLLNQTAYEFWKKIQLFLMKSKSESYDKVSKLRYQQDIKKYHMQHTYLIEDTQQPFQQPQGSLLIYPFERHETYFKMRKDQIETVVNLKESRMKQLLIFVHGYQASSFDMEPISNYLKYKYKNVICLLSSVNEGRTEQNIEESAHRLAIEIKNFINSLELKEFQISFICHSLGGIIARACLKYLQLHKEKFNQFVSLCSPHLGYLYHSSTLISTSLWILNKVKKDASMIQLTMEDSDNLEKTYLFGLSKGKQLAWFNRIWFFGSKQDEYVPYWSAILEDKYFYFETQASKLYKTMLDNLVKDIEAKIIRCEVVFNQKTKDLSNFIGRTAHIKILNFVPGIQLFCQIFTP